MKRSSIIPVCYAGLIFLSLSGCAERTEAPSATDVDPVPATTDTELPQQVSSDSQPKSSSDTDIGKVDAENVLVAGLAEAKESNRRVLVHLGAPW